VCWHLTGFKKFPRTVFIPTTVLHHFPFHRSWRSSVHSVFLWSLRIITWLYVQVLAEHFPAKNHTISSGQQKFVSDSGAYRRSTTTVLRGSIRQVHSTILFFPDWSGIESKIFRHNSCIPRATNRRDSCSMRFRLHALRRCRRSCRQWSGPTLILFILTECECILHIWDERTFITPWSCPWTKRFSTNLDSHPTKDCSHP
jgi:hypothetical protein